MFPHNSHQSRSPSPSRKKKWCNALNLNPRSIRKYHVICESHFPEDMFTFKMSKELSDWAVPSGEAVERVEYIEVDELIEEEVVETSSSTVKVSSDLLEIEYITPDSESMNIKFECDICRALFRTREERNTHIDTHFQTFECEACGKVLLGEKQFKHHQKVQRCSVSQPNKDTRIFECFVCHKEGFFTERSLRTHFNRTHDEVRIRAAPHYKVNCKECNKTFANAYILKAHIIEIHRQHEQHQCKYCGKMFNRLSNLKWHQLVHKDELPCVCKICGKAFRTLSGLNLHKRTHTGEKPYKCDICNEKSYAYNTDLKRHKRSAHGIVDKIFTCEQCERVFYERKFLRKHMAKEHNITI